MSTCDGEQRSRRWPRSRAWPLALRLRRCRLHPYRRGRTPREAPCRACAQGSRWFDPRMWCILRTALVRTRQTRAAYLVNVKRIRRCARFLRDITTDEHSPGVEVCHYFLSGRLLQRSRTVIPHHLFASWPALSRREGAREGRRGEGERDTMQAFASGAMPIDKKARTLPLSIGRISR